jgi:hypothetical protein
MVPGGSVGRPLDGTVRKERSATALRAYIASRVAGRPDEAFLRRDIGLALNTTAVRRAAGPLRWHPPGHKPPGRPPSTPPSASSDAPERGAIRDWVTVDAAALDLGAAVITIPADSIRAQATIYRALTRLIGVVRVFTAGDGEHRKVVAIVLVDGESDRRRLRAQLDETAYEWHWDDVDSETVEPALATWKHLARLAAASEGLQR